MSARSDKLNLVKTKLVEYGRVERERLVKQADWLRQVQRAIGIGAIRSVADTAAEEALHVEVKALLKET